MQPKQREEKTLSKPARDQNPHSCEIDARMGRIADRPYWVLILSIVVRAAHQIGAAVLLAVYLLGSSAAPPKSYAIIAILSGILLLGAEWWRHRQIYRELAGLVTIGKLLLLGAAYHGFLPLPATVLLVFFIASIATHAPKKVRHRLLL